MLYKRETREIREDDYSCEIIICSKIADKMIAILNILENRNTILIE